MTVPYVEREGRVPYTMYVGCPSVLNISSCSTVTTKPASFRSACTFPSLPSTSCTYDVNKQAHTRACHLSVDNMLSQTIFTPPAKQFHPAPHI
jgi:hypothetical protein